MRRGSNRGFPRPRCRLIALDVVPALPGGTTTMTLRAINQRGVEFDRVVFSRKAAGRQRSSWSLGTVHI